MYGHTTDVNIARRWYAYHGMLEGLRESTPDQRLITVTIEAKDQGDYADDAAWVKVTAETWNTTRMPLYVEERWNTPHGAIDYVLHTFPGIELRAPVPSECRDECRTCRILRGDNPAVEFRADALYRQAEVGVKYVVMLDDLICPCGARSATRGDVVIPPGYTAKRASAITGDYDGMSGYWTVVCYRCGATLPLIDVEEWVDVPVTITKVAPMDPDDEIAALLVEVT